MLKLCVFCSRRVGGSLSGLIPATMLAASSFVAISASADDFYWDGHCSDDWHTICGGVQCDDDPPLFMRHNNWGLAFCGIDPPIPGANDFAFIPASRSVTIRSSNVAIKGLDIADESTLLVNVGRTLYLTGPMHVNDGVIKVNYANANAGAELIVQTDAQISGSGEIFLDKDYQYPLANLKTDPGVTLTNGPDHTIRGQGYIYASIDNQGTISADIPSHTLRLFEQDKTNSGTIEARDAGVLNLYNLSLTQSPVGRLFADNANVRVQDGVEITGGILDSTSAGEIQFCRGDYGWNALRDVTVAPDSLVHVHYTGVIDNSLSLRGNAITNNGLIKVNEPNGTGRCQLIVENDIVMSGFGEIRLDKFHQHELANLITADEMTLTNGAEHTIAGRGHVRATMINDGLILADVDGSYLRLLEHDIINNGVMSATNNGTLWLTGGVITQAPGGRILADGGVVWFNDGVELVGGTVESIKGGRIALAWDTRGWNIWRDVTVAPGATVDVEKSLAGNTLLILAGSTFVNDGTVTVTVPDSNGGGAIEARDNILISGSGSINLNKYHQYELSNLDTADGCTITNGPNHTIRGRGHMHAAILNEGLIAVDTPGETITMYARAPGFVNDGTMSVTSGATMEIREAGWFTQFASGAFFVDGSLSVSGAPLELGGGSLMGAGAITGDVNNLAATVEPGTSIGTLTLNGHYMQGDQGVFHIEIAGREVGEYDRMSVSGTATFGGTLHIELMNGFEAQPGDRFEIMTYGDRVGEFSTIEWPSKSTRRYAWRADYGDHVLTVEYVDRLRGSDDADPLDPLSAERIHR